MRALYIAMRCDHILKEGECHGTICNSPHFRCYREGITECIPVSSTGHMIIIGHMLNFEGTHAAAFSFIMAVPVMIIVCVYDLVRVIHVLELNDIIMFVIDTVVSYIVGYITVKGFFMVSR